MVEGTGGAGRERPGALLDDASSGRRSVDPFWGLGQGLPPDRSTSTCRRDRVCHAGWQGWKAAWGELGAGMGDGDARDVVPRGRTTAPA